MPGTFSQIYIQIVFAVKNRRALISPLWEERLYQYITGIIQKKDQKMIAINGMPDHVHLFIGIKPNICLSDLVREVKKSSNNFINDHQLSKDKFDWQEGYGAFSYGQSQIDTVCKYVLNQKRHHQKQSFKDEYIQLLEKFNIEYQEKYLFDCLEL